MIGRKYLSNLLELGQRVYQSVLHLTLRTFYQVFQVTCSAAAHVSTKMSVPIVLAPMERFAPTQSVLTLALSRINVITIHFLGHLSRSGLDRSADVLK